MHGYMAIRLPRWLIAKQLADHRFTQTTESCDTDIILIYVQQLGSYPCSFHANWIMEEMRLRVKRAPKSQVGNWLICIGKLYKNPGISIGVYFIILNSFIFIVQIQHRLLFPVNSQLIISYSKLFSNSAINLYKLSIPGSPYIFV